MPSATAQVAAVQRVKITFEKKEMRPFCSWRIWHISQTHTLRFPPQPDGISMNLQGEEKVVNQTGYDAHHWAHAYINIPSQNAKNKPAVRSKTAGLRTIARMVNTKVMSYAKLSRFIPPNVRLWGGPYLACAHSTSMSFDKSSRLARRSLLRHWEHTRGRRLQEIEWK